MPAVNGGKLRQRYCRLLPAFARARLRLLSFRSRRKGMVFTSQSSGSPSQETAKEFDEVMLS
jgi:hypothetical protein